jgi:hypothetical protein
MSVDAFSQPMVVIGDDAERDKCTAGNHPRQIFIDPKERDEDQGAADKKYEQAI